MIDFLTALGVAFGVVFVAELGDKTQLLALGFGARHSLRTVAIGLTLGYAVANLIATVVGAILGAALPARPIEIAGGIVFLVFAVLAIRHLGDDDHDDEPAPAMALGPTATVAVATSIATSIAIAELGDKTQIATTTLASQSAPVAVWIGATLGAASSGMVGALAGNVIGNRIPVPALHVASAALFAIFGVAMLAGWF
jgi:putative Ca2+/H+ antiporter (TMEM165/GDT1 family)